jgi:hypothetical protein
MALDKLTWIVACPFNDPYSGGQVVLHKLADYLERYGEDVYILSECMFNSKVKHIKSTVGSWPDFNINLEKPLNIDWGKTIVIYPEIISNNPLNAEHITRWMLYHNKENRHETYNLTDHIFYYQPEYAFQPCYSIETGILTILHFPLDKFYDMKLERKGSCYVIHKKSCYDYHSIPLDSIYLGEYRNLGGFEYLNEVFNKCEYFISFDDTTALSVFASLAGCKSIILEGPRFKNPEEFRKNREIDKYGVAYGWEDLKHALSTQHLLRSHLEDKINENDFYVKNFINFWYGKILKYYKFKIFL